jgi:uncharacterized iron-regulated membrane protein
MTRKHWVLLHRYAGIYLAFYLIVAGATGSLISFHKELDHAINPALFRVMPANTVFDAPSLIEQAEVLVPEGRVTDIILKREPEQAIMMRMVPRINPATNEPYVLDFTQLYLDPYTGLETGRRRFGDLSQGFVNLMPFIYQFHYSLALGKVGSWLFGIAAIIWMFDCFVGFYLTLPLQNSDTRRSYGQRWKPAWLVKWRAGTTRVNFDLHRATGLWVWPMLLVFAWSGVYFNLGEQVYKPVMQVFFEFHDPRGDLPKRDKPLEQPMLSWGEALQIGRKHMTEQALRHSFIVEHEVWLALDREHGVYHYGVHSDRDIAKWGQTQVLLDANNGTLKTLSLPSGHYAGNTVTNWLSALHQGEVFGLPYRIFVCVLGVMVVMLSVTGIVIWLKKRRARTSLQRANPQRTDG